LQLVNFKENIQNFQRIISTIKKMPGNSACVDCGQRDPTWISVNLGILICTECSGIHRQIGVNYSKVRSLDLDQIGTANLLIARTMSNETFNEVYEALDNIAEKPRPGPKEMKLRESYIYKKYVLRSSIQRTSYGEKELGRDMEAAIKEHDMHTLLQSFAEVIILLYIYIYCLWVEAQL
jgi:Arf-GAP/SH3 domain/ANK repeat/PH domain-containing protein